MSPLDFLHLLWPAQGLYCIATKRVQGKGYDQEVFETIDAAAEHVAQIATSKDVFFCVHTLVDDKVWNPKRRRNKKTGEWEAGWSVRLQSNMRAAKAFFFDLDVGDAKGYPTQTAALEDLKRFVRVGGLVPPTVVSSGGGVHVYWVLTEEVASAEWILHATRLRQLAAHHGLKFDPVRTTDTASMLRVAGTSNLKLGPKLKRPVQVWHQGTPSTLENLSSRLTAGLAGAGVEAAAPKRAAPDGLGSNLETTYDGPPPTLSQIVRTCKQMQRLALARGRMSEPEWYASLGIIAYTDKPEENAIRWSQGDPGYDRQATLDKLDQVKSKTTGMTGCTKLRQVCGPANEHLCSGCPFVVSAGGSIAKAAHLNAQLAAAPVVEKVVGTQTISYEIPKPPLPFRRVKDRPGVEKLMEDKEGKQFTIPVYPYDLYPIQRATSVSQRTEHQVWRFHPPFGDPIDFPIDASTFVDDKALRGSLGNVGIWPERYDLMREFMSAYIRSLQQQQPPTVTHNHVGWSADKTEIILPDRILKPDGSIVPVSLGRHAKQTPIFMRTVGTLADQKRLMHFFNRPEYLPNQFFILTALASPIFWATGHHGLIFNATGIGGCSKSTTLYTGSSMYGPPEEYAMSGLKNGGTAMYRDERMFVLCNLPFMIDEITKFTPEEVHEIAMQITQGTYRERLDRQGMPRPNPFEGILRSSLMIATANISLYHSLSQFAVAGTAASMRVFEVEFRRQSVHTKAEADDHMWQVGQNYGWIGPEFLKAVVTHREKVVNEVRRVMQDIGKAGNVQQDERFWFAGAASALVAADVSSRIGLLPYNPKPIREWLLDVQIPAMRELVANENMAHNPLTVLTDFIELNNGKILKTYGWQGNTHDNTKPHGELIGHYDTEKGWLYILKSAFRDYCQRKKGLYAQDLLTKLFHDHVVASKDKMYVLGKGLRDYEKGHSRCFQVNMKHPDIAGVLPSLSVVTSGPRAAASAQAGP